MDVPARGQRLPAPYATPPVASPTALGPTLALGALAPCALPDPFTVPPRLLPPVPLVAPAPRSAKPGMRHLPLARRHDLTPGAVRHER
jgi:hypothetical protein